MEHGEAQTVLPVLQEAALSMDPPLLTSSAGHAHHGIPQVQNTTESSFIKICSSDDNEKENIENHNEDENKLQGFCALMCVSVCVV